MAVLDEAVRQKPAVDRIVIDDKNLALDRRDEPLLSLAREQVRA
jgi:hypothetical protein